MTYIPNVLKEGTRIETKESALSENIMVIRAISEAIKSTYGPMGLNKMIIDSLGDAVVTNDCYTILDELNVEHPTAKMVVKLSKNVNKSVGDGVTKSIIFLGELLKYAEELLSQKIHPNVIISGFNKALREALRIIDSISKNIDISNKTEVLNVLKTALKSKLTFGLSDKFAEIAYTAVYKIKEMRNNKPYIDLDLIQIIKKEGGQLKDSIYLDGVIIDKEVVNSTMPKIVHNAKIALIDHSLEVTKTEFDSTIKISDPEQIASFKDQENSMIKEMVDNIVKTGANVVFCQKGIDDIAQYYLAKHNIMAIRRVKKSDLKKLMKATHAKIMTDIKALTKDDLGFAEKVEEKQIGKDNMIFLEKCKNPNSVSILLRGGSRHIIEDAERTLNNVLSVAKDIFEDSKIIPGAGAIEIEIAKRLRSYAKTIKDRQSIVIEYFSYALESLVSVLISNLGLDPLEILTKLKAKHENKNNQNIGFDIDTKEYINSFDRGIIEPSIVLKENLKAATELALMIIRIDEFISASKESSGPKMPGKDDELED